MYRNGWLLKLNFSIGGLDRNIVRKSLNIQQLLEILHVLVGNSVSHFYVHINARHNHSMLSVFILKQLPGKCLLNGILKLCVYMYFCGIFIAFAYPLQKISTGNSRIGTKHHWRQTSISLSPDLVLPPVCLTLSMSV